MTGNGSKALRRYRLRTDQGRWVADVVISDDGYFSTVSDYGGYAHFWGDAGCEFRRFLCGLDADYLCGKLSRGREYDDEATLRAVKRAILDGRRGGRLSKDEARREWELLGKAGDLGTREEWAVWSQETKLEDAYEHWSERYPRELEAFARRAWPILCVALRAEIEAERGEILAPMADPRGGA
jgi:hypothetical protein